MAYNCPKYYMVILERALLNKLQAYYQGMWKEYLMPDLYHGTYRQHAE